MVLLSSMTRTFKPLKWELVSVTRKPLLDKQNPERHRYEFAAALGKLGAF
jgi:hypothetical protein